MGLLATAANPFNSFGAIKLIPNWAGFWYMNAGPKALANKADQKNRQLRGKEADLLIAQMGTDAKSGMYFNVYQLHGVAWGRVERFLKNKGYLYMYDHGNAKTPFQMCVAVCWMHESKWTANGNLMFFETAIAHFIGECIAAACCDTVSETFTKTLVKTIQKKFVNPKASKSERETQEVNAMISILEHIMLVAIDMAKEPDKSKPIMNVAISKGNSSRVVDTAINIFKVIVNSYGKDAVETHAFKVVQDIVSDLPREVAKMSKKERDERLAMKADQAQVYQFIT